jgi:hypothetical protein
MFRRAAFILLPSSANGFGEAFLLFPIVPIEMLHPCSNHAAFIAASALRKSLR